MHLPGLVILRLGLSLKCLSWFLLGSHPSRVWTPSSLQSFLDMNGLPHIFCCWRFRRDATRILPWVSTQGVTSKCISRASRAARGPLPGAGHLRLCVRECVSDGYDRRVAAESRCWEAGFGGLTGSVLGGR